MEKINTENVKTQHKSIIVIPEICDFKHTG